MTPRDAPRRMALLLAEGMNPPDPGPPTKPIAENRLTLPREAADDAPECAEPRGHTSAKAEEASLRPPRTGTLPVVLGGGYATPSHAGWPRGQRTHLTQSARLASRLQSGALGLFGRPRPSAAPKSGPIVIEPAGHHSWWHVRNNPPWSATAPVVKRTPGFTPPAKKLASSVQIPRTEVPWPKARGQRTRMEGSNNDRGVLAESTDLP